MRREILVSASPKESWVALLEDGQLVEAGHVLVELVASGSDAKRRARLVLHNGAAGHTEADTRPEQMESVAA